MGNLNLKLDVYIGNQAKPCDPVQTGHWSGKSPTDRESAMKRTHTGTLLLLLVPAVETLPEPVETTARCGDGVVQEFGE